MAQANWYVSSVAYAALTTWNTLTGGIATVVALNQIVRQTSPTAGNERVFRATTGGTSGTVEPTWNLNDGATTTDSGVTWTQIAGREAEQAAGNWKAPFKGLGSLSSGPADGDVFFVSQDHAETRAASYSAGLTSHTRCKAICVSRVGVSLPPTATDLATTATVSATGGNVTLTVNPFTLYAGITFSAGTGTDNAPTIALAAATNDTNHETFLNSAFTTGSTAVNGVLTIAGPQTVVWDNTAVKIVSQAAAGAIQLTNGNFEWRNTPSGGFSSSITSGSTIFGGTGRVYVHGVDLSNLNGNNLSVNQFERTTAALSIQLEGCKLDSGFQSKITSSTLGTNSGAQSDLAPLTVDNCFNSTDNWRMIRAYAMGLITAVSNPSRASGATDTVTPFSHRYDHSTETGLSTFGNAALCSLHGSKIRTRFNTTGSSKTCTVEALYGGATIPTNLQAWIDAETLDTSGDPILTLHTTKPTTILDAASNCTASTATWNATARQNTHVYATGDVISTATNPGRVFLCTSGGTSAGSEPGGFATAVDGGSVTDSGATFRAMWRIKFAITFTAQLQGLVTVDPHFAISADTGKFFVDPFLTIA